MSEEKQEIKEEKETKAPLKVKAKKPTNLGKRPNDEVFKVKLKEKEEDAVQIGETKEVPVGEPAGSSETVSVQEESSSEEKPQVNPIKEVSTEEKELEDHVPEEDYPINKPKIEIPESVEKLINFMKDTGGNMEDYVRLNADYSNIDEGTLLKEYYAKTKPHLDEEEILFLINDQFNWDEDLAEDREKKKKTLAMKEEVAKARTYLDELKGKYYDEIKLRPGVTQEQQKAMDFFNRYNKQQEQAEQLHETFKQRTQQLFNEDFKGFDFEVAGKRYKYNIQNREKVAENQSNITNLVGKFLDPDGNVVDPNGYHKAMYAAENVDKIATHFYEQGKADAVKEVVNKSKNLSDVKAREGNKDIFVGGFKVKAISGADSTKLKIQKRKFN